MKIAITGASGFIGTNYVDFLLGREGTKFINIDKSPPRCIAHGAFWRECDILDFDKLQHVLCEFSPDFVVHLAADTGVDLVDIEDFRCNYHGVENLISACEALPNLKHIVFASSLLVCKVGYIPRSFTDFLPSTVYGVSKVMGEMIVRQSRSHRYSWTIVRPISIWGPWNDQPYASFFRAIMQGWYFHIGDGNYCRSLGYVLNAVQQIHSILEADIIDVSSKTFYIADPNPVSLREMAELIKECSGSKHIRSVPLSIAKYLSSIGDIFRILGWRSVPLTSFRLRNITTEYIYDLSPISSLCSFEPIGLRDGIRATLDHLRTSK